MGTHLIPREVEGEGRILIVFTMKGFAFTLAGLGVGYFFFAMFKSFGAPVVGWIMVGLWALIGFILGQVKLPKSNSFDLLKKVGGDYVLDVIINYFKFRKNRKIYTYEEGVRKK